MIDKNLHELHRDWYTLSMNFTGLSELFLALLINSSTGFDGFGPIWIKNI